MPKLVFGMNQSLDGYVDQLAFSPRPTRDAEERAFAAAWRNQLK